MIGYISSRTIYMELLENAMTKGQPYSLKPNTSLNEKFDILPTDTHPVDSYPTINYFAIGNGGNNILFNSYRQSTHKPFDGTLYNHVPFIIREINSDLTISERADYRFRNLITINGVEYVEYYLKKIPNLEDPMDVFKLTSNNDNGIITEFNFNNSEILNPVPDNSLNPLSASDEYVVAKQPLNFYLSVTEIEEIKNAINIKFGENGKEIITEIGICTGYDKDLGNGTFEAVSSQIGYFIPVELDIQDFLIRGDSFERNIDIGSMQPLKI